MKAAEFTDRRPSDWIAEDDTPAEESGFGWVEDSSQMIYADSSMTLPGKGDRGKNCGQWYPQEFCNECGEPRFGESRCLERNCPECWRAWSKQRTVGIIERLQKAREAANSGLQKRVVHAVASPPQDSIQYASKDSIRWYGSLSTAKFRAEKEISDGAISTIERKAAEAVEKPIEDDSGDDTDNEAKCVECGSANFSSIFEAGGALIDQGWCDRIGPEQEHRLNIAFQWAINEIEPPPGLKNPGSEADAREAFKELL